MSTVVTTMASTVENFTSTTPVTVTEPPVKPYIPYLALGEFVFMEFSFFYSSINYTRIVFDMIKKRGAFKSPKSLSLRIHILNWFIMSWVGVIHTSYLLFWWRMPRNYNLYFVYWSGLIDNGIELATPFAATLLNFETMLIILISPILMHKIAPFIRLFAVILMSSPLAIMIYFRPEMTDKAFNQPRPVCWDYACFFFAGNPIFYVVKFGQAAIYIAACVGLLIAIRLHSIGMTIKGKRDRQAETIVKFTIAVEVIVKLLPQFIQYYLTNYHGMRFGYILAASPRCFLALDDCLTCWKYSRTLLPSAQLKLKFICMKGIPMIILDLDTSHGLHLVKQVQNQTSSKPIDSIIDKTRT
uniref:Acyl_transf_3 domain-containing protein n=1 Tax=Panagrellus redivivus TaxID=6233 RepID=A0A7E4UQJ3_PANRE